MVLFVLTRVAKPLAGDIPVPEVNQNKAPLKAWKNVCYIDRFGAERLRIESSKHLKGNFIFEDSRGLFIFKLNYDVRSFFN